MTQNQLAYMANLERARDNWFNNIELNRSNLAKERENTAGRKANIAMNTQNYLANQSISLLDVNNRNDRAHDSNLIKAKELYETGRHNLHTEAAAVTQLQETNRYNTDWLYMNALDKIWSNANDTVGTLLGTITKLGAAGGVNSITGKAATVSLPELASASSGTVKQTQIIPKKP